MPGDVSVVGCSRSTVSRHSLWKRRLHAYVLRRGPCVVLGSQCFPLTLFASGVSIPLLHVEGTPEGRISRRYRTSAAGSGIVLQELASVWDFLQQHVARNESQYDYHSSVDQSR